jgi:O-methyltransferase
MANLNTFFSRQMARAGRVAANPGRYLRLIPKIALQKAAPLLTGASFRLESQMDIHPVSLWHDSAFTDQFGGFQLRGEPPRTIVDLEPWDSVRRDMLVLLLRDLIERRVPGDMAELGVYKGLTAKLIHHYVPEKTLHLYDTFQGFDTRDVAREATVRGREPAQNQFSDTTSEAVLRYITPKNSRVHVHPGFFPESVPESEHDLGYCFVHLDADLYAPIMAGLEYFYPRMERGGFIVVHDFNAWPGARRAVMEFFAGKPEIPIPMPDHSGSALISFSASRCLSGEEEPQRHRGTEEAGSRN